MRLVFCAHCQIQFSKPSIIERVVLKNGATERFSLSVRPVDDALKRGEWITAVPWSLIVPEREWSQRSAVWQEQIIIDVKLELDSAKLELDSRAGNGKATAAAFRLLQVWGWR